MKRYRRLRKSKFFSKKKINQRKKILKWFFLIFSLAFLTFYFFFLSEGFKIREIKILTSDLYLKKEIGKILLNYLGKNIFLINSSSLEKEILKNYPELKIVFLKKKLPASLILTLKKRSKIATFCLKKKPKCYFVDDQGVIFLPSKKEKNFFPIVFALSFPSSDQIKKTLFLLKRLKRELNLEIEKADFSQDQSTLKLKTKQGWELYFLLEEDLNLALVKLKLLLKEEITPQIQQNLQYIDLRFSKVYYR